MKIRIVYKSDGRVSILQPFLKSKKHNETDEEFSNRFFEKAMLGDLKDLPFDDIDSSELPQNKNNRAKWRGSKGEGIHIDESIKTKKEIVEEAKIVLDIEMDKSTPNPVTAIKLMRAYEKAKELPSDYFTTV